MKKALFNAVCIIIALLSGISLFILKYQVKEEERLLKTIHREILQNKREIHMLEAEWAHLNDPKRLAELVKTQTKWETISAKQISTLSDIPLRPEVLPAAPEVIELESSEKTPVEQKVVQESVPIKPSGFAEKTVTPAEPASDIKPQAKASAQNVAVSSKEKPQAKSGSVKDGVWKPASKTILKPKSAAKNVASQANSVKKAGKGVSKPIVAASSSNSSSVQKGSSALSTLLNKGGKR